jgi:hypothetical protein
LSLRGGRTKSLLPSKRLLLTTVIKGKAEEEIGQEPTGWPPGNGLSGLRNQDRNSSTCRAYLVGRVAAVRLRRPKMSSQNEHAGASRISLVWSECGCGCERAFYRRSASAREGVLLLAYPEFRMQVRPREFLRAVVGCCAVALGAGAAGSADFQ